MKHDKTRESINLEIKLGAKRDMENIWKSLLETCCIEIMRLSRVALMHWELGKWWSSTAETWSSCILGLSPWTYNWCSVCRLSVCLSVCWSSASRLLRARLWNPRGKEYWPPPSWLAFWWPTVNIPFAQQHYHLEHSPSHMLLFSSCVFTQILSFCLLRKHTHTRLNRIQGLLSLNHSGQQVFQWCTPKQLMAGSFVFVKRWKLQNPCTGQYILIIDIYYLWYSFHVLKDIIGQWNHSYRRLGGQQPFTSQWTFILFSAVPRK